MALGYKNYTDFIELGCECHGIKKKNPKINDMVDWIDDIYSPRWAQNMRKYLNRCKKAIIDIVEKDCLPIILRRYKDMRVLEYREKHIDGFLDFLNHNPLKLQKLYDYLEEVYYKEYKKAIMVEFPTADPSPGERGFSEPEEIFLTCKTPNVDIFFTIDGEDVDPFNYNESTKLYKVQNRYNEATQTWERHSNCIITEPCVVKAVACRKHDKIECSFQAEFNYTQGEQVATPVFEYPDGSELYADTPISITCDTEYAEIRYTIDNDEEVTKYNSFVYKEPIILYQGAKFKAKAFRDGMKDSEEVKVEYTSRVRDVEFKPEETEVEKYTKIYLSTMTKNSVIRYTTDGSDVTNNSPRYSTGFEISTDTTVKAQAFRLGSTDSSMTSKEYTITNP